MILEEFEKRLFILGFTSDGIRRINYKSHSLNYDNDSVMRVIMTYDNKKTAQVIEIYWGPRVHGRRCQTFVITEIDQAYNKVLEALGDSERI